MTSIIRQYSQSDNRVETITLSGFLTNNGTFTVSPPQVDHPAFAEINLTLSKNFTLDARNLVLRTEAPSGHVYLIHLYISSITPPAYTPNREFQVIITLPLKGNGSPGIFTFIKIFTNKDDAYNNSSNKYTITNLIVVGEESTVSQGRQILTFEVVDNSFVLKALSPGLVSINL